MTKIVAFGMVSLDGRINDKDGKIGWHTPDDEVHEVINDQHSRYSDHIYDEPTYEIMKYWENPQDIESMPPVGRQYTDLWQKTHKTIISKRLSGLNPDYYSIWPELTSEGLSNLKKSASGDIMIGGTDHIVIVHELSLLDRIDLWTVPVIHGGGELLYSNFPRIDLQLLETRSFAKGWIFSSYEVK